MPRRREYIYPLLEGETREEHAKRVAREYAARWHAANPNYGRENSEARKRKDPIGYERKRKALSLRRYYGMRIEQFEAMLAAQNGVCWICKKPETVTKNGRVVSLSVDHCHDTHKIRGLLCKACNSGIGHFYHTPELLLSAVQYLEFFRPELGQGENTCESTQS